MTIENIHILDDKDRGRQKMELGLAAFGGRRASKNELYLAKLSAAEQKNVAGLAEHITGTFDIQPQNEFQQVLVAQFSDMPIHSILIPNDYQGLRQMSQSVLAAEHISDYSKTAGVVVSREIVDKVMELIRDDRTFSQILPNTLKAIRALRNLSIIDDRTLSLLMLSSQYGVDINFDGLSSIFEGASNSIIEQAKSKDVPPQIIDSVINPIKEELMKAHGFIDQSSTCRFDEDKPETVDEAFFRGLSFADLLTTLTLEHVEQKGSDKNTKVAQLLIESLFAHKVHWTPYTADIIGTLHNGLTKKGQKQIADEVLLYAQKSGLLPEMSDQQIDAAGLPVDTFKSFKKTTLTYLDSIRFNADPLQAAEDCEAVTLFLGFQNGSHLGHRELAYIGRKILRGTKILVSINRLDPNRSSKVSGIPEIPFDARCRMAVKNLAGLVGNELEVTSIDNSTNPELPPIERQEMFMSQMGGRNVNRINGFDRRRLVPKSIHKVLLGLRGYDLRSLIQNPEMLENIHSQFEARKFLLVAMQGTTNASASSLHELIGKVRNPSFKGNKQLVLNQIRSMTHPLNYEEVLQMLN